jgi:hypothetical protein
MLLLLFNDGGGWSYGGAWLMWIEEEKYIESKESNLHWDFLGGLGGV